MSDRKQKLEFARSFDGSQPELSELEMANAAELFKELIDDSILDHVDAVIHFGPEKLSHLQYRSEDLFGGIKDRDGTQIVRVNIESTLSVDDALDKDSKREVLLTESDPDRRDTRGRTIDTRSLGYVLDPDSKKVYRYETDNAHELHHGVWRNTKWELLLATNSLRQATKDREQKENQGLEHQLGVNLQPVGFDEILALGQLLPQVEFRVPYRKPAKP